jgi:hypothetical protein
MLNTRQWNVSVCHNFTTACAHIHQNQTFDFIYIDARHDYKGVTADIENWFPKLNYRGIIAGHDYLTAVEQLGYNDKNHWEVNGDGTLDITKRAVMGAVDDFFGLRDYPLVVVDSTVPWKSWVIDTSVSFDAGRVPTIFHFVWLSMDWKAKQQPIPDGILQRIDAWKRLHPHWYAVIWTNAMAERHFPSVFSILKKLRTASWASNILRYHVIARYGGVYLDTDIVPLRPLPSRLLNTPFTVCERPRNGGLCTIACNAVIASPQGNTEIQAAASEALLRTQTYIAKNPKRNYDVNLTGPRFWSQTATAPGTSIRILPSRTFFPCDWTDREACIADRYSNDSDVYAMHTWQHSWKR